MNRAFAAALALALLAPGSVGAQSSSPEASVESAPLYAPEDLASILPTQVGPVTLAIQSADGTDLVAEYPWMQEELLPALGKELSDVSAANGRGSTEGGAESLAMVAIRIDGVPAEDWLGRFLAIAGIDLDDPPPDSHIEWLDLDGGGAIVVTNDGPMVWQWGFYPKGEVLFVVSPGTGFTAEEILAELP